MIALSVNINKVATLRNSRGGDRPSVLWAARTCIEAGCQGITVHPRADERHIRPADVRELAALLKDHPGIEYNIEGDARPDLLDLATEVKPNQCTLVPTTPGEITSDHGYRFPEDAKELSEPVARLKDAGIRVSIFVEAGVENLEAAREIGVDRIELYTGPFADLSAVASAEGEAPERRADRLQEVFETHIATANDARALGMGVNAGHDLDLNNLTLYRTLPGLAEVSIGHAIICDALEMGLAPTVRAYLDVLAGRIPAAERTTGGAA